MISILSYLNLQNFYLISVAIAVSGIGILGFSVFFNNRKSITNLSLLLFCVVTILWSTSNYLAYQINNTEISFWLFKIVIAIGIWHAFLFFQTFFVFPEDYVVFPKWYKFILIPLTGLVSIINLTPLVFSGIKEVSSDGYILKIDNGPCIALFGLLTAFFVVGGLVLLFIKMIKAVGEDKRRYGSVLVGVIITFILIMTFNFVLPAFFDDSKFIPLGAIFIFPFVAFTSFSIIKYKLFNIKIVATAVLVFLLSIVSFFEIIFSNDIALIIYRSFVLLFILFFGLLLIRGVLKEVKQREQIEKMNEEITRAYEVEKKAEEDTKRAYETEKKLNEELDNLDKVKNQFLMQTQHDLRTPLSTIKGYCELLITGTLGKQSKKTLDVVKRIYVVAGDKIKDVNNFLDITQFQLGKKVVSLKPGVELAPILDEIFNQLETGAKSKGIYLKLEKPFDTVQGRPEEKLIVEADREKLKSALFNVVDNSIKYTPNGGVTINLKNQKSNAKNDNIVKDKILITVKDTGIGIPKEKVQTLFDTAFERGEQAKKTFTTGRGIGLYLSSQIVKAHNGRIWAESEGEGKGSTFSVELPADPGKPLILSPETGKKR